MAEAQVLTQRLLTCQNPDGGWSYGKGLSWAEPTAFVVLALQAQASASLDPALSRGISWLLSQQKTSGGWAPTATVDECTSVTSVATLALLSSGSQTGSEVPKALDKALGWTAGQVYKDDFSLSLLLARALHLPPPHAPGSVPWYPGTAGWVMPTSFAVLALMKAAQVGNRADLHAIANQCCSYLLSRQCGDSGWNHGGSKTRSEDAKSYPETTGLALFALRAGSFQPPASAVTLAKNFASNPQSLEGLSWIQMALGSSHDRVLDPETLPPARTTRDAALRLIALEANNGRNILLSA